MNTKYSWNLNNPINEMIKVVVIQIIQRASPNNIITKVMVIML